MQAPNTPFEETFTHFHSAATHARTSLEESAFPSEIYLEATELLVSLLDGNYFLFLLNVVYFESNELL